MTKLAKESFERLEAEVAYLKKAVEKGEKSPTAAMSLIQELANRLFIKLYNEQYK